MDTNKKINVIKDLKGKYEYYLTIGKLKKFLEEHPELPDDALVLTQRVEDVYYEKNGWGVVLKEGEHYHNVKTYNVRMEEEIRRRKNGEHPKYDMEDPSKHIQELTDDLKDQYHPAFCCLKYKDDDNLYLDLHY
jgi:hypothetical protein